MPWFRMYVDFLNDPKMIALAFEDQRHFIGLLALKSDGALDADIDPALLDRIVAQRLWIDHAVIREVKKRLVAAGLIGEDWQPLAWDRRQMKSDGDSTAAARQRRSRAAKKATLEDVQCNVTDVSRVTERDSHADVTRLDTDTDTDKETEEETVTSFKGRGANLPPDAPPSAASPPPQPSAADALSAQAGSPPPDAAPRPSRTTATRLPADWRLPKSWGQWALEERPDLSADDVRREAEIFTDYWHAKAGADARKANWEATWRNWVRRADGRGTAPRRGAGGQAIDPHAPVETYAQRAARQRVEEVAPGAARKAPGQRSGFEMAQAFMHGADVIDVVATARPQQRIAGGV